MNLWNEVNSKLIAKSMSELHFEEVLFFESSDNKQFSLNLKSGARYTFTGRVSAWGHVWVDHKSIRSEGSIPTAAQFFIDSIHETQMNELTLGNFLEELNNTLYSDLKILEGQSFTADEMSEWNGEKLQSLLSGHPKLLLNKGRIGWGAEDLSKYSPESGKSFQLEWILAKNDFLNGSQVDNWNLESTISESFSGEEKEKFNEKLRSLDINLPEYKLLPVHPWQWANVIQIQFQSELRSGNLIHLGVAGDFYLPQVSIRTLANADRPIMHDIKLPLTILNTSCVRGLPQKYLPFTPFLSKSLTKICDQDSFLSSMSVEVLSEISAWGFTHPGFHAVKNAPYRYHEQLGAVWRESVQGKLAPNEKGILAAALFHVDQNGKTLLEAYAAKAEISVQAWLKQYTKHIILPLYHLQLEYGVGLVAHGQNVVVKLRDFAPAGIFLKDFHGDLRLSTTHHEFHKKHFLDLMDNLTHLPPEHLIHDLVTGHLITVLRFMAGALHDSKAISEEEFYKTVSHEIKTYLQTHPSKPETNILAKKFQRVLVNKVRFMIGYGDSASRPLPLLGSELTNPLYTESSL